MKPNVRFVQQPLDFWAHVRSLSQELGYTEKTTRQIKTYSSDDVIRGLHKLGLTSDHFLDSQTGLSAFGTLLLEYFQHRATVLNEVVQHNRLRQVVLLLIISNLWSNCRSILAVTHHAAILVEWNQQVTWSFLKSSGVRYPNIGHSITSRAGRSISVMITVEPNKTRHET